MHAMYRYSKLNNSASTRPPTRGTVIIHISTIILLAVSQPCRTVKENRLGSKSHNYRL